MKQWECLVCGTDAEYAKSGRFYCRKHWNHGQPDEEAVYGRELREGTECGGAVGQPSGQSDGVLWHSRSNSVPDVR